MVKELSKLYLIQERVVKMKLPQNYIENVYIREELTPAMSTLINFNISKALQNTFVGDKYGGNPAYIYYRDRCTKLLTSFQLEKIPFSELVELLVQLRFKTWLKFPSSFRQDGKGWYDLKVAREKDAKDAWLAMPVDKALLTKAKREGRVVVIVRK